MKELDILKLLYDIFLLFQNTTYKKSAPVKISKVVSKHGLRFSGYDNLGAMCRKKLKKVVLDIDILIFFTSETNRSKYGTSYFDFCKPCLSLFNT